MKTLFTPPMRWAARLLVAALAFHLLDYSHSVWLRAHPKKCYDTMSPDKHYILRICTLRWEEWYYLATLIENIQVIDPRMHRVLYEHLRTGMRGGATEWWGCREEKGPENDFTPSDPGICIGVNWDFGGYDEDDNSTELPPSRWEQFKARLP